MPVTRDEAKKFLLDTLDMAVSAKIAEYPILGRLDIYNTLQLLSWTILERQPSLSSSAIFSRKE